VGIAVLPSGRADREVSRWRWAWPLAARAAHELHDGTATSQLLALLDSYQSGEIAPMLRLAVSELTLPDLPEAHIVVYTPRDDDTRARMPLTRRTPATAQVIG
jgi:hypothetical protein